MVRLRRRIRANSRGPALDGHLRRVVIASSCENNAMTFPSTVISNRAAVNGSPDVAAAARSLIGTDRSIPASSAATPRPIATYFMDAA